MRLCVCGLDLIRGNRLLFSGLEFSLSAGEALIVLGPNGAGKSSLLRAIAGLLAPSAGSISLEGGEAELTLAEQAHYLGHQDPLKPALTVKENLQFWSQFLGPGDGPGWDAALAAVALEGLADLPAGYLSAGQKRRLSLARLIAVKRPVWLLDEPSSGLDAGSQERLAQLMREHLRWGLIVAASHTTLIAGARELRLPHAPPLASAAAYLP